MKNITKTALTASLLIVGLGLAVNGYSQSFPTNGLAAYYPFNGNANDASGNGHNGINQGGVLVPDSFGYPNQAYRFDGTNGFIDLSQNRPITGVQTTFSICGWIKPRYIPQLPHAESIARGIYWHRADWRDIGVRISNSPWYSFTTTTLEFCTVPTFQSANHNDNLFASQLIPTNTWTAFAATYDGATKSLYINGTLDASVPYTFEPNWDTGFMGEGIGGNFAGQAETFDGIVDNIRIYNRALSASEVQQLYAYESGPRVNFVKAFTVDAYNLSAGSNYVLEASSDLTNWTTIEDGISSTTGSFTNTIYWRVDDWNKLFFRLQAIP